MRRLFQFCIWEIPMATSLVVGTLLWVGIVLGSWVTGIGWVR
jgi:hypothetical protein